MKTPEEAENNPERREEPALPADSNALIDQLLQDYKTPEQILGENGLLKQLTRAVIERALGAELADHLGYNKHDLKGRNSGNSRNGSSRKTVKSSSGELTLEVPRDRNGSFEPILVPKRKRRIGNFDDLIVSLYARGLTTSEIQAHVQEIYGTALSLELISSITDAVMDEVKAWQARPLGSVYPIVYLDAIVVKARVNGHVAKRVIYLVIGVNLDGYKEVLGFWACEAEGAKFWAGVLNDLKNRGVQDILIACVDGLKGFPEAIQAVFPRTAAHRSAIVHCAPDSLVHTPGILQRPARGHR
jgi:putative transposase